MEKKYVLALDSGTTSCRAILFNRESQIVSCCQEEFPQYFPKPGWVEHNPVELFDCQLRVMKNAVEGSNIEEISSIGITNQRETVVLWDKNTGVPVYNAIVWQCRRTAAMAEQLIVNGYKNFIHKKTGLIPDAYFSGTKIKWILDNVPGVRDRALNGEILAGTIDTWLVWKLTGGKVHVTDYTNASRTMLFNINTLKWDQDLLDLLEIPSAILPQVKPSSCVYGTTDKNVCGFELPIASCVGDQQAALFGQGCFETGDLKTTYGTGCFMLMNTGDKPVFSEKLVTTVGIGLEGRINYALEGSVFIGGAAIKWLREQLGIISSAKECDELAATVPDSSGVVFVPAFTGLGSPYWDPYARGTILGLTRGASKAHICRATLEAICYQVKDLVLCMESETVSKVTRVKVDGGASKSVILMQMQSDILDATVIRPVNTESTAAGAAYCAGLATGFWNSLDDVIHAQKIERVFTSSIDEHKRNEMYAAWKKAVIRSMEWVE